MLRKVGRPLKYGKLINMLKDETLYTPSTIAFFSINSGYLKATDPKVAVKARRIRISCAHIRKQYEFPATGDGQVCVRGHQVPGWLGSRWKDAVAFKQALIRDTKKRARKPARKRRRKPKEKG